MQSDKTQTMMGLFAEYSAERLAAGLLDAESRRHTDNIDLFEAMIREVYDDVTMIVAGHHIMFMRQGQKLPTEIPSADALIFDHAVARGLWKDDHRAVLTKLALEPTETRDALLRQLFNDRVKP